MSVMQHALQYSAQLLSIYNLEIADRQQRRERTNASSSLIRTVNDFQRSIDRQKRGGGGGGAAVVYRGVAYSQLERMCWWWTLVGRGNSVWR